MCDFDEDIASTANSARSGTSPLPLVSGQQEMRRHTSEQLNLTRTQNKYAKYDKEMK